MDGDSLAGRNDFSVVHYIWICKIKTYVMKYAWAIKYIGFDTFTITLFSSPRLASPAPQFWFHELDFSVTLLFCLFSHAHYEYSSTLYHIARDNLLDCFK